jgi:citrate lyase beta subunit
MTVAMIETPDGLREAEAIAAVPGIDLLLIGTNDLCASLGITEDSGSESEGGASRGWPRVYLGTGGRSRQWPKGGNGGSRGKMP